MRTWTQTAIAALRNDFDAALEHAAYYRGRNDAVGAARCDEYCARIDRALVYLACSRHRRQAA